jgi:hypothetical protein
MNKLRQHAERHGMTILDPKTYAPA